MFCQAHLHTASETFVCHKKNRIRLDFLRFCIRSKHFDLGKDDEYEKKERKKRMRKYSD